MSLHLGNLPSRIRRDELEHVFRRFGRCNVRIKDKFGFVDYEYPPDAEKALGALRGTRICGGRITLAWSKMQPPPYQGHAGRERPNEQMQRRYRSRGDGANRKSDVREGHRRGLANGYSDQTDGTNKGGHSVEGNVGRKDCNLVEGKGEESNSVDENGSKVDEWEEKLGARSAENVEDFDRYEPCLNDGEKLQQAISYSTPLDSAPIAKKSEEKPKSEHLPRPFQGNGVGSEMENCSKQIKIEETLPGIHFEGDVASGTRGKIDEEPSTYYSGRDLLEHEEPFEEKPTLQCIQNDYQEKKRSSEECNSSDKQQRKKSRVLVSSYIHSDYGATGSQSPSRSTKSLLINSSRSGSKPGSHQSSQPSNLMPLSLDRPPMSSPQTEINQDYISHEFQKGSAAVENGRSRNSIKSTDAATDHHAPMRDYTPAIMRGMTETSSPLLDHGGQDLVTSASKILTETTGLESVRENKLMQMKNLEMEASQRSKVASSMRISSNDMCMILKNCGQRQPEDRKENLAPDAYFGSGRLWPWEIIYYRRLKKGPISKENYEWRLLQNQEFGIADKYIRSSSGWGELTGENSRP